MAESDCVVVMGSNMAENHPVAFRWPMVAKANGATLIHVDPRFTRTSAMADVHAPIRAGSDIAFLGGLVNYVLESARWNTDPFFKEWVRHYTNAATLIGPDFKDAEDLDGVFSGLKAYTGGVPEWPLNGQPAWSDTPLLGPLFVVSAASVPAALLILLGAGRGLGVPGLAALERFDAWVIGSSCWC